MRRDLRAYLGWMAAIAPWQMAAALLLMVMSSLMEGAGIALLPSILNVAGIDLQSDARLDGLTRAITGAFAAVGLRPTLAALLVAFFVVASMSTLLGRLQYMATITLDQKSLLALRQRLYRAIVAANWQFLCRSRPAELMHTLTTEISRVGQVTILSLSLAAEIALGLIYVGLCVALSPSFAAVLLAAAALLVLLLRGTVRSMHDDGASMSAAALRLHGAMNDVLQQLKTAKTFGLDDRPLRLFAAQNQGMMDATLQMGRRRATASALFEVGVSVALCAMVYVLVGLLSLPAASVLIALLIFSRLMPHLQSGHRHLRELAGMLPAFAIVTRQIERCEAAVERTDPGGRAPPLRVALRFAGVTFSHVAGGAAGVRDVDLVVPAGKIVAIVGPSGAGKSTIVDLAMGLLLPQAGEITIDGQPLAAANAHDWRRQIGYVGQDAALLNLSIRENMLWADPAADDHAIMAALTQAGVDTLVRGLPHGLDSVVGERGVLFSQGERQRLALARALLRRPTLLVLDEATNGLDVDTETAIMQRITDRAAHMTVVVVAHRLSTIRSADVIYAVEAGKVSLVDGWDALARREEALLGCPVPPADAIA